MSSRYPLPADVFRFGSPAAAGRRARTSSTAGGGRAGRSVLLIAPTGGGKTLAGFLPTLVELYATRDIQLRSRAERSLLPPPVWGRGRGGGAFYESLELPHHPDRLLRSTSPTRGKVNKSIASLAGGGEQKSKTHLHRPRHPPRGRAAHALHLAPEGARRRHRAQSRNAGREMGLPVRLETRTGDTPLQAAAPAPRSARHPADHAGTTGAAARQRRCAVSVRHAQARRARRIAFARHLEARRSAVARPRAAVRAGARAAPPSASRRPWPSPTTCAAS